MKNHKSQLDSPIVFFDTLSGASYSRSVNLPTDQVGRRCGAAPISGLRTSISLPRIAGDHGLDSRPVFGGFHFT